MQKWAYFSMGIMAGIIFVLAFMLLGQHRDNLLYADMVNQDVGGGTGTFMVTGGTGQQLMDMCWVLYRRPGKPADAGSSDRVTGDHRLTLCAYKIGQGSKGKMELLSVRDISYDVEIFDYESVPSVREIKKKLEEESKKKKD